MEQRPDRKRLDEPASECASPPFATHDWIGDHAVALLLDAEKGIEGQSLNDMADVVFVIGAGASAPFGVPTLQRVFQDEHARRHLDQDAFLRRALDEHFWGPRGRVLDTSHLGLTVEEILTILRDYEHQTYDYLPPLLGDHTERFVRSLYVLIKKAIFDGKDSRGRYLNAFIAHARRRFQNRTWASFNWDCIFEASYYYSSGHLFSRHNPTLVVNLDDWNNRATNDTFLKLHGGINWWYHNERIAYLPFARGANLNLRWSEYERGAAEGQPVILEPSYYKYADRMYELLRGQWDHFVTALLNADSVVVLGYSLPEADTEARRALMLGFQGNSRSRWLVVDRQVWVCERYQRLFGDARLQTICADIGTVANEVRDLLDLVAPNEEDRG